MVEMPTRTAPLSSRSVSRPTVMLTPAAPASRLSLRAGADAVAELSGALGLALPVAPKTSTADEASARAALWLGPDEWLVVDMAGGDLMAACASVTVLHSAVDISHRNTAIIVEGVGAEATLNAGCPQDLTASVFPVGACSRTVLGKIEVVIWRTGATAFRVECWRSFATYAFDFLEEAARDAAA